MVTVLNTEVLDRYKATLEDTLENSAKRDFAKVLIQLQTVMAYMQMESAHFYRNCSNLEDRIRKEKNRELVGEYKSAKKWVPLIIMGAVSSATSVAGGVAGIKAGEAKTGTAFVYKNIMEMVKAVNEQGAGQAFKAYEGYSEGTKTQLQSDMESLRKKSDDMINYESQSHTRQTDLMRKAEDIEAAKTRAFASAAGAN